jgi:hypothetical protein
MKIHHASSIRPIKNKLFTDETVAKSKSFKDFCTNKKHNKLCIQDYYMHIPVFVILFCYC